MTVSRAFFQYKHIQPTEGKREVKTRTFIRNCSPFQEVCLAVGIEQLTVGLHHILGFLDMLVHFLLLPTSRNLLVILEQDLLLTVIQM